MNEMEICMDEFEMFRRKFKKMHPGGTANKLLLHWWAFNIHSAARDMVEIEHVRVQYSTELKT